MSCSVDLRSVVGRTILAQVRKTTLTCIILLPRWEFCPQPFRAGSMAYPTEDLINAWNAEAGRGVMTELLEWAQIPATIRTTLLGSLGAEEQTHYRMFAFTPPGDVEELLRDLRVTENNRVLNIGEKGAVRLLFNAIRCAAGTLENPAPRTPPQIIVQAPASQELTATSTNAVALNGTVSQVGARVTKRISIDEEKKCHANYKKTTRGDCPPEASPNRDQISALRALVEEEDEIGVDMAVWVPFANRLLKKRAVDGWRPMPDGKWQPISLFGPPTPKDWGKSYKLFRSGAIMDDIIDLEWLDQYGEKVFRFVDKGPAEAWALIYQVEARTRTEHAPRVRRQLESKHEQALEYGWPTDFDPKRPWNAVWRQLVEGEEKWWNEELNEALMYMRTGVESPLARVAADQPISSTAASSVPAHHTATRINDTAPPVPTNLKRPLAITDAGGDRGGKRHKCNSKGTDLCAGYQDGSCCTTVKGRCSRDGVSAHQCAICLDNRHGASQHNDAVHGKFKARPARRAGAKRGNPQ